ncbi:MAG: hypothetical protein LUE86_12125 [Clostridiales bacterium]|nr:hypothetical protein [Clostridiales bacterium]
MVRRICPICDQVMKSAHYCTNCRCRVKKPYVRDVTYYLNERHPSFETDCEYHDSKSQTGQAQRTENVWRSDGKAAAGTGQDQPRDSGWVRSDRGRASCPSLGTERRAALKTGQEAERSRQERERNRKQKGGLLTIGFTLILIVVILNIVRVLLSLGLDVFHEFGMKLMPGYETDVDLGTFSGAENTPVFDADDDFGKWDDYYTELEDWEAIAGGEACTMEGHFAIAGADVADWMRLLLDSQGLAVCAENSYSYNVRYQDEDTWFSTWRGYASAAESEDRYPYVESSWVPVTGDLHSIEMMLENTEQFVTMTDEILDHLGENGAITEREQALFDETEWTKAVNARKEYEVLDGTFSIWGTVYGEDYSLMISRMAE